MDLPVGRATPMTLDLGILLALACAFVANLGFFFKYRGANSVPKVQVRHPLRSARQLYSSKWFTLGMITATGQLGPARRRALAGADVGDPGRARRPASCSSP